MAVPRPVRRFNNAGRLVYHAAVLGGDIHDLQRTFDRRFCCRTPACQWVLGAEFHVGEFGLFYEGVVMSANPQPDIKRLLQLELERASGMAERLALRGDGHEEAVALLVDANSSRPSGVGLDLVSPFAASGTVLKGGQAVAVEGGIHISRVGIETLTNQQTRFTVRLFPIVGPANAGRQRNIA